MIFISGFTGFFSDLGSGDGKKEIKSSENDQLTWSFSELFFFFHFQFFFISREQTVKLVK